jgi:predicted ribosomally synthesized peptide with nif11-like leader
MSQQNVVRFLERLASDRSVADEVGHIERNGGPDAVRQLIEVAEKAGYAFTESELQEILFAARQHSSGELADDELEQVAAGTGDMSLQETSLDQTVLDESASFAAVSNILKTKHDTTKNSISNVR